MVNCKRTVVCRYGSTEGLDMIKKISKLTAVLLLVFCLLPVQAFATGYYDSGLPQPDEYFDPWGGYDSSWGSPTWGSPTWGGNRSWDNNYSVSSSVSAPVITSGPSSFMGARGDIPGALRVEASSYDGGYICYQWYMSYTGNRNEIFAVNGAIGNAYTPEQILGTVYYCAGVYSVSGELRSEEVFTDMVPVTYSGIEITNLPNKLSYTKGAAVDLSGLVVTVYDGFSGSWQSTNGSGLSVYPSVLNSVGQTAIEVSYNGSSDVFYVSVGNGTGTAAGNGTAANGGTAAASTDAQTAADGSHVHTFGEWEVTKPATCVTTGIETRRCEVCGETETQEIPRTDHTWDEGVITKEPTETSNGARLYTCTICKANKSEIIPAGSASDVDAKTASLNINGGDPQATDAPTYNDNSVTGKVDTAATGANGGENAASGKVNNNGSSSGWWLIPVSALLLVGTGTGAYYLMRKKGSEE